MLENSILYRCWVAQLANVEDGRSLLQAFAALRKTISEQSKIIIHVLPEYTPHDATRHLEQLFPLADRVLGGNLYEELNFAELSLLVFGLYAHDWGMAVGTEERETISGTGNSQYGLLLPDEARTFQHFRQESTNLGKSEGKIWEDYLRRTHAQRSGLRLRNELMPLGHLFAEMTARVAEGHVLDIREIRDPAQYPIQTALFGRVANVAAVACYVRIVDLLDVGEDRTPFALWSIVRPHNEVSRTEWNKHRALAPVAVNENGSIRQVLISGTTDDPDVFAALADLRSWINAQFADSVGFLRHIGKQYDLKLDSTIKWDIKAVGFEPVLLHFDFDRSAALGLLSREIYGRQRLTFIRELLQNSIDAIDTRIELLKQSDTIVAGRISIKLTSSSDAIQIEWTDNGIGMDRYILDSYFTKIGRSWYQSADFRRHSLKNDPISKFGVGMLSCFSVSPSLTVITKRDPALARDSHGWRVDIRDRDGYFTVRVDNHANVGTTILLHVNRRLVNVTAGGIVAKIKQVAALVKYEIVLTVDGSTEVIHPVDNDRDDPRLPFMRVSGLDDSALASLRSLTVQVNHRYGSPSGTYEAFFSWLLPRDISSITSLESNRWQLGPDIVDFDDFIIEHPQHLFVKGVASGAPRAHLGNRAAVALNIFKPSLISPNLSRADLDLRSVSLDEAWADAAYRIRDIIGQGPPSIEHRVNALAVARRIAEIPDHALANVVPYDQWPIWVLNAGSGLSWREASSILNQDEVLAAPHELGYVLTGQYSAMVSQSVRHWAGPTCFVMLQRYSGPWWGTTASLAGFLLEKKGVCPTELRFLTSASDDSVPIVCQVWRKVAEGCRMAADLGIADLLEQWRLNPKLSYPQLLRRALTTERHLSDNAPLLFPFPGTMDEIAAIGSLYWNQNNQHVCEIVEVLLELSMRAERGSLSGRAQKIFDYVNGNAYLGYVVPSRHSTPRVAIDRFRELILVAAEEGLAAPKPLEPKDFFPGSVGKYWNPYHYPVWSWPQSERVVGAPWSTGAT